MVIYFIVGIPMDPLPMLMLTIPIFLPVLKAYHIDLLWFGVLAIVQFELANLTPPVGMYLFVVAQMVKKNGISMGTVFRGSIPFCVTCAVFIVLLIAFPQIALFMVSLMK
jgi:TRAP-type C4-dicarboxylate transport system permease large subunit